MEPLDPKAVAQVEAILRAMYFEGRSIESVRKPIKEVAVANGWDWLVGKTAADFGRKLMPLVQTYCTIAYERGSLQAIMSVRRTLEMLARGGLAQDD